MSLRPGHAEAFGERAVQDDALVEPERVGRAAQTRDFSYGRQRVRDTGVGQIGRAGQEVQSHGVRGRLLAARVLQTLRHGRGDRQSHQRAGRCCTDHR